MPKLAYASLSSEAHQVECARRVIREALKVLAASRVDTFLGRKSYEPFPKETHDPRHGEDAPF
ncbi:hypothetical protein EOW77_0026495 [Bradyrhizobium yuanmingense]|nr:hypothetical protein EOW77_0026495 [Bradyrhizobium yuanmingense]